MKSIFDKEDTSLINELCELFRTCGKIELPGSVISNILIKASLDNQSSNQSLGKLRASSIGKPVLEQVLNAAYPEIDPVFNLDTIQKLVDGIITNTCVSQVLTSTGYDFQEEVPLPFDNISGHADFIVTNHETKEIAVIEVKSMASHLVSKFVKVPNDNYGYLSQLSYYHGVLELMYPDYNVNGMFLVKDRGMCFWNPIKINEVALRGKFSKVQDLSDLTQDWESMSLGDYYDFFPIPLPEDDMIPKSLEYSRWKKAMYQNIIGTPIQVKASREHFIQTMRELA